MTSHNDRAPGGEGRGQRDSKVQTPRSYGAIIPSGTNRVHRRAQLSSIATAIVMAEVALELDHGADVAQAIEAASNRLDTDLAVVRSAAANALHLVAEVER